jgi:hypothetical protein
MRTAAAWRCTHKSSEHHGARFLAATGSPVLVLTPTVSGLPIIRRLGRWRRVYPGVGETLEGVLANRLHFGRCRSHAAQLRAHAQAGGSVAEKRTRRRRRQGGHLRGICVNSKRRSTLVELYMTCTSNRSMRNSGHGRFGVSLTHSLLRSRNWIQFRS